MVNKEHIDFLYEKGYTNIEDINNDEINFIYSFEKQNEKEIIEPISIPYYPVKWHGEKHYEIIMKLFTNLEFVRMENINDNFSEFYIFPILKYKSKNYQINKTPKIIIKKIKRAVTDSGSEIKYNENNIGISNLMTIYSSLSGQSLEQIENDLSGKLYSDFKKILSEVIIEELKPIQKKYSELIKEKSYLEEILSNNANEAYKVARKTLSKVQRKIGLIPRK